MLKIWMLATKDKIVSRKISKIMALVAAPKPPKRTEIFFSKITAIKTMRA